MAFAAGLLLLAIALGYGLHRDQLTLEREQSAHHQTERGGFGTPKRAK
jgi:hypothetical protein